MCQCWWFSVPAVNMSSSHDVCSAASAPASSGGGGGGSGGFDDSTFYSVSLQTLSADPTVARRGSRACDRTASVKPYVCSFTGCTKAFKTATDLTRHKRVHTGYKPYMCSFAGCDRRFSTNDIRKVHMRQHTGERPYVCSVVGCGKSFTTQTNHKNHARTHTGERPFLCQIQGCGKRFAEYSTLHKHQLVHQAAAGSSSCCGRQCPRRCRQPAAQRRHVLPNHADTVHSDIEQQQQQRQQVAEEDEEQQLPPSPPSSSVSHCDLTQIARDTAVQEVPVSVTLSAAAAVGSGSDKLALIVGRLEMTDMEAAGGAAGPAEPLAEPRTQLFILPAAGDQVLDEIAMLNCSHHLVTMETDSGLDLGVDEADLTCHESYQYPGDSSTSSTSSSGSGSSNSDSSSGTQLSS